MLFRTHLAFSFLCSLLSWSIFDNSGISKWVYVVIFLFASLLPDIDKTSSFLGKHLKIIGWIFGHRGLFHSFFPIIAIFVPTYFVFGFWYALAIAIGYLSHLLLDMLNYQGVGLFFPISKWRIKGFCKSGGLFEKGLFIACLIFIFILTLVQ